MFKTQTKILEVKLESRNHRWLKKRDSDHPGNQQGATLNTYNMLETFETDRVRRQFQHRNRITFLNMHIYVHV